MTTAPPPTLPPDLDAPGSSPDPWQVPMLIAEAIMVLAVWEVYYFMVPKYWALFQTMGAKLPALARLIFIGAGWRFLVVPSLWTLVFGLVTLAKFCLKSRTARTWCDVAFNIAILGFIALVVVVLRMALASMMDFVK